MSADFAIANPATETQALGALGALAHSHRLRVFRALVVAGDAGVNAGDLAAMLGMPASSMSFHLKELSRANLAHTRVDGRFVNYRANYAQMSSLIAYLTEHCCAASPSPRCVPSANCCDATVSPTPPPPQKRVAPKRRRNPPTHTHGALS